MANITAAAVNELRKITGSGLMDCKKALVACEGDMDKAVDYLREKGLAGAAKKADRVAAEGMAYAAVINGVGVVVEVNCESDFVGGNEMFQNFVKGVAEVIARDNPADVAALMACKWTDGATTVEDAKNELFLSVRENMNIRRFARVEGGLSVPYVHMNGKVGVLVNLETESTDPAVVELGKDVAMQICAMRPTYLDKSNVTPTSSSMKRKSAWPPPSRIPKTPRSPKPSLRRSSWAASRSTTRRSASCSRPTSRARARTSPPMWPLSPSRSALPSA